MRWLPVILLVVLALLQYPLWFGSGGWFMVWEHGRQLEERQAATRQLQRRNDELAAEVRDLQTGSDAIEERARFELGMVKPNEDFLRYPDQPSAPNSPLPSPASGIARPDAKNTPGAIARP